jgi:hypothetical protein
MGVRSDPLADAGAQVMDGACESPGKPDEYAGTEPGGSGD